MSSRSHSSPPTRTSISSVPDFGQNTTNPWVETLDRLKTELGDKDLKHLRRVNSLKDLEVQIQIYQQINSAKFLPRLLERLGPFFDGLQRLSQVINIFVSSKPEFVALIWGVIAYGLDVATQYRRHMEYITDMFVHLSQHLPRIQSYLKTLVNARRLETAIRELYYDMVHFFILVTKFFRRRPIWNIIRFGIPWASLNGELELILKRVKEKGEWIDAEAIATYNEISGRISKERHVEIMQAISPASAPNFGKPQGEPIYKNIPFLRCSNFYGRQNYLDQMSRHFSERANGSPAIKIFSLLGMAGIGKSQIALEYCYSHWDSYDCIFWIVADTQTKIFQYFSNIHRSLKLSGDSSDAINAQKTVKFWFQTTAKSWLLVVDNLENLEDMEPFWPVGGSGSIIITSRIMALCAAPITGHAKIERFTAKESAELFLKLLGPGSLKEQGRDEVALTVGRALDGLPLALRHFSSYVESMQLSLKEFQSIIETRSTSIIDLEDVVWNRFNTNDYHYAGSLSNAWDLSLSGLEANSMAFIKLLTFFDPDFIFEKMFKEITDETILKDVFSSASGVGAAIGQLLSCSFVERDRREARLVIHRLTQAIIFRKMSEKEKITFFTIAINIFWEFLPVRDQSVSSMFNYRELYGISVNHIQRLDTLLNTKDFLHQIPADELQKFGFLLVTTSIHLKQSGLNDDARKLLDTALNIAISLKANALTDSDVGTDNILLCKVRATLGDIEFTEGNIELALTHFEECLAIKEAERPDRNLHMIANCLILVGNAYSALGRSKEGLVYLKKSLEVREEHLKSVETAQDFDEYTALHYGNLAACLLTLEKYDEALANELISTQLSIRKFGENHEVTASGYFSLSRIKLRLGSTDEAEEYLWKSVEIYNQTLKDNPKAAFVIHNLARLLHQKGENIESLQLIGKAVRILRLFPNYKPALGRSRFMQYQILSDTLADMRVSIEPTDLSKQIEIAQEKDLAFEEATRIWRETGRNLSITEPTLVDFDGLVTFWDQ